MAKTIEYPLREQRRIENRQAFITSARSLFDKKGFLKTTMAQIADGASLHVQTLYSHFPSKQALVSQLEGDRFREALASSRESTLQFWCTWVHSSARIALRGDDGSAFLEYIKASQTEAQMAGVRAEIGRQYMDALAEGIAVEYGVDLKADRLPVFIAYMVWGGNVDAVRGWSEEDGTPDLVSLTDNAAEQVKSVAEELLASKGYHLIER